MKIIERHLMFVPCKNIHFIINYIRRMTISCTRHRNNPFVFFDRLGMTVFYLFCNLFRKINASGQVQRVDRFSYKAFHNSFVLDLVSFSMKNDFSFKILQITIKHFVGLMADFFDSTKEYKGVFV